MTSNMADIQSFLKCPICFEPHTKPKTLPCFHTFCEHCLRDHVVIYEVEGEFPCPTCRHKAPIPENGVQDLDNCFFIKSLRAAFPVDAMTCDVCKLGETTTEAVSMCINCTDHLCQSCADIHHKTRYTADHLVISMTEVRSGQYFKDIRDNQRIFCSKHPNKDIEIYCKKCETPICILCKTLDHEDHKVCSLEDVARKVNEQLTNLLEPLLSKLNFLAKAVEKRKQIENMIEPNKNEKAAEIKKWAEMKHAEIDLTQKELLEDLETATTAGCKQAAASVDEVETQFATVKSTSEYVQRLVQYAKPTEKLERYPELCDRLVQLQKQDLPITSEQPLFMFRSADLPQVLAEIKRHVITVQTGVVIPGLIPVKGRILQTAELISSMNVKLKDDMYIPLCEDIAVDGDSMYIPDWANGKLKVFDKIGQFKYLVGDSDVLCKIKQPIGVTVDQDGNIIVADDEHADVHIYDKNRQYVSSIEHISMQNKLGPVVTNVEKQILVQDYDKNSIQKFNYRGTDKKIIDGKELGLQQFNPRCVATSDVDNSIIVPCNDSKSVHILDSTATKLLNSYKPTGPIALKYVSGVCADQWGNIIVINDNISGNMCSVHLISSCGDLLALLISERDELHEPVGVAIFGLGAIAIMQKNGCVKIYKYMEF